MDASSLNRVRCFTYLGQNKYPKQVAWDLGSHNDHEENPGDDLDNIFEDFVDKTV